MKNLRQYRQCPGRDFNRGPTENEPKALPLDHPTLSHCCSATIHQRRDSYHVVFYVAVKPGLSH
jgi:hypothetical protein